MKPPLRTKSVGTKVGKEQFVALEAKARDRNLTLSEWVRAELLEPHRLDRLTAVLTDCPFVSIHKRIDDLAHILSVHARCGQVGPHKSHMGAIRPEQFCKKWEAPVRLVSPMASTDEVVRPA